MPHLLFDIDGTLMLNGTVMRDVFEATFEDVTRCPPTTLDFSFAGFTDRGIFEKFLAGTGREDEVDALFDQFTERYCRNVAETYPTAEGPYTLAGAAELVRALSRREEVDLALSTGNLRRAAYIKLARFDLDGFFPVGGFGDHFAERWRVVDTAWAAARDHYGDRDKIPWVIGDTRQDIEAARRVGARVLAVATGPSRGQDLADADIVVNDLTDTDRLCDILCA